MKKQRTKLPLSAVLVKEKSRVIFNWSSGYVCTFTYADDPEDDPTITFDTFDPRDSRPLDHSLHQLEQLGYQWEQGYRAWLQLRGYENDYPPLPPLQEKSSRKPIYRPAK